MLPPGRTKVESSSKGGNFQGRKRKFNIEHKVELTKDLNTIFKEVRNKIDIEDPPPLRTPKEDRDQNKYCWFHKDVGHHTNDCFNLRRTLESLALKGKIGQHLFKS